jgi:hypothetical protein
MQKATHGWDRTEGVKYCLSSFEEEEFKKWHENGGREILSRKLYFFDYSDHKDKRSKNKVDENEV